MNLEWRQSGGIFTKLFLALKNMARLRCVRASVFCPVPFVFCLFSFVFCFESSFCLLFLSLLLSFVFLSMASSFLFILVVGICLLSFHASPPIATLFCCLSSLSLSSLCLYFSATSILFCCCYFLLSTSRRSRTSETPFGKTASKTPTTRQCLLQRGRLA